jgi:hypothetical protein
MRIVKRFTADQRAQYDALDYHVRMYLSMGLYDRARSVLTQIGAFIDDIERSNDNGNTEAGKQASLPL